MGLRIHSNAVALAIHRDLHLTGTAAGKLQRQLSSGLRIATAGDDAAGHGISERMRATTRSYTAAQRNAADGIALLRTVDGYYQTTLERLARMEELALQAMNGVHGELGRAVLAEEFGALAERIDEELAAAELNGLELLPSERRFRFFVGTESESMIEVRYFAFRNRRAELLGIDLTDPADRDDALDVIERARDRATEELGKIGAGTNRLESALRSAMVARNELSSAESRIRDVDVARATAELARESIVQQAGVQALGLANLSPQLALSLLA